MSHGRRSVIGRIIVTLSWIYATAASIFVVVELLGGEDWRVVPRGLQVVAVLLSLAVIALEVSWVALFFREMVTGEGHQYLLSRSSEGTARISLRAIQASLFRRVRELPEVIGARVVVRRPAEKRLRVEVAYTTTEDRNAILVSEAVRRGLRERFEEIVHPEEGFEVEYDVKIDGFVPGAGRAPEHSLEPEEAEEPFIGPRYPID
jgi:hypothetical protein